MSDETPKAEAELTELEPLEELEELPELPSSEAPRAAAAGSDEAPPLRELEDAPKILRKAALIAVGCGMLPWIGANYDAAGSVLGGALVGEDGSGTSLAIIVSTFASRLIVLAGAWLMLCWVRTHHREEDLVPNALRGLAHVGQGRVLPAIAVAVMVVGCLGMLDGGNWKAVAEKGMLAWAAVTWVHIYGYERWGKFNPLFPLMFIGHAVAGLLAAVALLTTDMPSPLPPIVSAALALGVSTGGFMAVYTLYAAMKQAKIEGEAKKAAALEARKAARKTRRKA